MAEAQGHWVHKEDRYMALPLAGLQNAYYHAMSYRNAVPDFSAPLCNSGSRLLLLSDLSQGLVKACGDL